MLCTKLVRHLPMVGRKRTRSETSSQSYSSDGDGSSTGSESSAEETSDGDSSSSNDASSTASSCSFTRRIANLSFNQVFHGDEDDASEDDVYQKNGKSKKRILKAMGKACCARKCKRRLVLKAVYILVASFWSLTKGGQDALLWSMQNPMWVPDSDDDDDAGESASTCSSGARCVPVSWHLEGAAGCKQDIVLLHQCQVNQSAPTTTVNLLCIRCGELIPFGGVPVCRTAFLQILGISPNRLVRCRRSFRGMDGRRFCDLDSEHMHALEVQCHFVRNQKPNPFPCAEH